ncbi:MULTISPECIES: HAD-IA family hydrolase [Microbacterium]|uniref:HAD-IA family hydrolase n=1 Tax=Microbacterium sufflavum TaxID=2851649 RepID=A0ABY4IIP8_9MICO|nr:MULTISPECIES: HAD-IA family hydrolase [Microbacterium]MBN6190434.1 HAD-IA family hydrolase [Aneurinibacillus sp. BA2021]MCK2026702.1 HAD-IA family hydrolase [Microbacterium sufflavum]UPL11480.1 HAD-IA family hydrolase [Microbacterium sufflavum]
MTEILRARAALLDMDGTLVDSTAVVERLWLAWAEPHGLDPETVLRVVHGRQGHQSMAILLPERDHAINLHENEIMLATEAGDVDGVVGIAGADRLLAALETVPHAIVTSANVALMTARMQAAGLTVPELAVTAENVSASKPDPEGFLLAARMLGVAPAECVVFEDSGAGIQAGLAAGMRVVGVGRHAGAHAPTVHVDDLTAVTLTHLDDGFELRIG